MGPSVGAVSEVVVLEDKVVVYCWEGSWEEELGQAGGQCLEMRMGMRWKMGMYVWSISADNEQDLGV